LYIYLLSSFLPIPSHPCCFNISVTHIINNSTSCLMGAALGNRTFYHLASLLRNYPSATSETRSCWANFCGSRTGFVYERTLVYVASHNIPWKTE
jgi:hypothetical protein